MTTLPPTPLANDCYALLDDATSDTGSRLYSEFLQELRCTEPMQFEDIWNTADAAIRGGAHALLLADYEWGVRLQGLPVRDDAPQSFRVVLFRRCTHLTRPEVDDWLELMDAASPTDATCTLQEPGIQRVSRSVDQSQFDAAIAQIQQALRAGDTYQINYTYRVDFEVSGTPLALYRRLRARQPVPYGALIALPHDADTPYILSLSPELFLRHDQGVLTARPMKGTAPRTGHSETDARTAHALARDPKNRAENLMIVDLLRNDLGRIATTGSVQVPALFSVEPYAGVFQMTSTVTAQLPGDTTFPELIRALFPCGSITGAPKYHTMELISELESTPRGLYTGMIGWMDVPAQRSTQGSAVQCGDFCLSVAIRTLTIGPVQDGTRRGRMGVGAGIVLDSRADDEYAECALKARFLTAIESPAASRASSLQQSTVVSSVWARHLGQGMAEAHASSVMDESCYDMAARYDVVSH
jgi:para-aminobenzoate synthetase/4-amino-4-deoxychorismate lyase